MTMQFRHVVDLGSGRPIVFIHGWSAHGGYFAPQLALAWAGYRVVVPDLPGHGHDQRPGTRLSLADLAGALHAYLVEQDLTDIVLVGWSMGAFVAYDYIRRYGTGRLTGFVSIDMTGRIVNDVDWRLGLASGVDHAAACAAADVMERDWRDIAPRIISSIFAPGRRSDDPLLVAAAIGVGKNDAITMGALWRAMADADYRDVPKLIDCPALVIAGAESQLYAPAVADWLTAQLPNATRVTVNGTGHAPQVEAPWAVNQALTTFLGRLPR